MLVEYVEKNAMARRNTIGDDFNALLEAVVSKDNIPIYIERCRFEIIVMDQKQSVNGYTTMHRDNAKRLCSKLGYCDHILCIFQY